MDDFARVYEQYAGIVKKYLLRLGANDDLSDDLTAETFYRALRYIDSYDGSVRMSTWLCTIAKHLYFNYIKKKGNRNLPLDEEALALPLAPSPQETAEQNEANRKLYQSLLRLPSPQKDVVYMRHFAALSFREIGTVFEKSETWARVTFYRAKQQLKELFNDEE